jgi:hypothetical protein
MQYYFLVSLHSFEALTRSVREEIYRIKPFAVTFVTDQGEFKRYCGFPYLMNG